jgi:hypothetical protein
MTMGKRLGWVWVTAALTAACWIAPERAAAGKSTVEADVIGAANPDGLMVRVIGTQRWTLGGGEPGPLSPYVQGGLLLAATPAYGKAALALEWLPHPVLQLIAESTVYRYFGGNTAALLSFPAGDASFGDREVDARKGEAESAWGLRLLLKPVLRVPVGPVLLRNVTQIAWLNFGGTGPYFLEWEYDTLLKDGDWYLADTLQALVTVWRGGGAAMLRLGPFYEIARASAAGIVQQRAGLVAAWTIADTFGPLQRPGLGLEAGFHLRDPNRQGKAYALFGIELYFELN